LGTAIVRSCRHQTERLLDCCTDIWVGGLIPRYSSRFKLKNNGATSVRVELVAVASERPCADKITIEECLKELCRIFGVTRAKTF
jgi:hypothetical protein